MRILLTTNKLTYDYNKQNKKYDNKYKKIGDEKL